MKHENILQVTVKQNHHHHHQVLVLFRCYFIKSVFYLHILFLLLSMKLKFENLISGFHCLGQWFPTCGTYP
jgi:hypothetical protein